MAIGLASGVLWAGAAQAAPGSGDWVISDQLTVNGLVRGLGVDGAGTAQVIYLDEGSGAAGEAVVYSVQRPRNGTWTAPQPFDMPEGFYYVQQENARGDLLAYTISRGALEVTVRHEGVWSPPKALALKPTGYSVLLNDAGQLLAVWNNPNGVHARIRTPAGRWGPKVRLAKPPVRSWPVAAFNAGGAAVVAWIRNVRRALLVQAAERRAGAGWSRPRIVSGRPTAILSARVALNRAGDALVGWVTGRAGPTYRGRRLHVVAHRVGTSRWTRPAPVPGARDVGITQIGIDGAGRGIVVWGGTVDQPVGSAVRAPNGRWAAAGTLPGACCVESLVVTPAGTAFVATHLSRSYETVRVWRRPLGGRWTVAPAAVGEGYGTQFQLAGNAAGDVVAAWTGGPTNTYNPVVAAAYQDPGVAGSGAVELSAQQLLINQRITQAAIRRVNALQAKVDGVPAPSGGGGEPSKVTLSVDQLLINQRIAQAAVRRVNALTALINGEPEPSTQPGQADRLTLSARQLLINQRISQAAVRRVNALAERIPDLPVARPPIGSPSLDRVIGVATAPRKMRITVVQRGSATEGAVVALVLPPPIRDASFVVPGSTVGAEGIVAEGTFYGFYVTVEPPDDR